MNESNSIYVQLLNAFIYSWHIKASDEYLENPVRLEHLSIDNDVKLAFNIEEDLMGVRLDIMIEFYDENEQKLGVTAHFGIENDVYVENMQELVSDNEGEHYTMDPELGEKVMALVYGTARGIILENTRGTILGTTVLPDVDPQVLLSED